MRGPMKMSSIGISQSSIVSFLSPLSLFCRISFLLLSSAELALALGLTLVGLELSDLLIIIITTIIIVVIIIIIITLVRLELSDLLLPWVGEVAGDTWSAIRTWNR